QKTPPIDACPGWLLGSGMRHLGALRILLLTVVALAATQAVAVEKAAPPPGDIPGKGSCLIVDYTPKRGDGYTWYYCPSSRVFVRPGQRWLIDLDKGVETRVLEEERKVRALPLSVKQEQQRAQTGQQSPPSFSSTG